MQGVGGVGEGEVPVFEGCPTVSWSLRAMEMSAENAGGGGGGLHSVTVFAGRGGGGGGGLHSVTVFAGRGGGDGGGLHSVTVFAGRGVGRERLQKGSLFHSVLAEGRKERKEGVKVDVSSRLVPEPTQ